MSAARYDAAMPDDQTPPDGDFVTEYRRREKEQNETASWHKISGAGVEFAGAVGLGALAGWLLDRWLDTAPWLLIGGVFLGFAIGLVLLIRVAGSAFK